MCVATGGQCCLALVALLVLPFLHGCAGHSRLYPNGAPENSLRLVEVLARATAADIQNNRYMREPLAAVGIQGPEARDRSVGAGRVYCCGGKLDEAYLHYFFIPADINVEVGDIVEIRCGSLPNAGRSSVNTVVRVVQKKDDPVTSCRWEPRDKTYGRILYCDWMPEQGCVKYTGTLFDETWVKPAAP
jgi:hypothetical protein